MSRSATTRLSRRIAALMLGVVTVFALALAGSAAWLTQALDQQARRHSHGLVARAVEDLLLELGGAVADNAKWDEAFAGAGADDVAWLYENIGLTATLGRSLQLAAFWRHGGPPSFGWTADGPREPQVGLLDQRLLDEVDRALRAVEVGSFGSVGFYAWTGGDLYALSAARVEPSDPTMAAGAADGSLMRLVVGERVDGDLIRDIEATSLVDGVVISRGPLAGRDTLALPGVGGTPVAYLAWSPPTPGRAVLTEMAPALAAVLALAMALAAGAGSLARRSAANLVEAEDRLAQAARTDRLTGLHNRVAFTEALAAPAPAGERAILVIDLDGFKRINDSLGHEAGDLVVARLAQRLATLADADCFLARIGGDEFVFLLSGANAGFRAEWLVHAVERALDIPLEVAGQRLRLRAAMGYAVQGTDAMPGPDLVRQADLAMHEAKRRRAGPDAGAVAFGALIDRADRDARAIETALRGALDTGGELSLAYQPIVDLSTGRLVRAEALARWTSPILGRVPPDRFVAVAEQSGLIVELGRHLLQIACDDLAAHPDLRISLNVSPLQLTAPTFVADLVDTLTERGVCPGRVEVELTERVVVDDFDLAARRVDELRAAGFGTALDDFGTGFSSIGTLQRMAFDTLKIDRAFVSGLDGSGDRLTLCNAMILLGEGLGLTVVCEGVETAAELDVLRELGCRLAQGYHFDRPLPVAEVVRRWLAPEDAADADPRPAAVA